MNHTIFSQLLNQLPESDWQAVIEGQGLLLVDDLALQVGPLQAANAIIKAPEQGDCDAATLQRDSIANAEAILANYYLTHPLTLGGFNRQAERLIEMHGAAAFAAVSGQFPKCTLFVDGGEVIAEMSGRPRHRYGAFCELDRPLPASAIEERVRKWLQRGEAHERYLGMNVCRYNC